MKWNLSMTWLRNPFLSRSFLNLPLCVPSRCDVIKGAGTLYAQSPGHGEIISREK